MRAGGEGNDKGWEVGWHHWPCGHEFEQTLGDSERRGNLACCSPCIGHNGIPQRVGHNLAIEEQQPFDWLTERGLRITLEGKWQGSLGEVYRWISWKGLWR